MNEAVENRSEMDTTPEQTAEGAVLVRVLAAVLDRLVGANAPLALSDPGQVTKFHALKAPGIGILQYLERYVGQACRFLGSDLNADFLFFRSAFTSMGRVPTNVLYWLSFISTA